MYESGLHSELDAYTLLVNPKWSGNGWSLGEKSALLRYLDNAQDKDDVSGAFGRLSTTIWFGRGCDTLSEVDRWRNKWRSTTEDVGLWWVPCLNKWNKYSQQDAGQNVLCSGRQMFGTKPQHPEWLSSMVHAGSSLDTAGVMVVLKEQAELWARDFGSSPVYWLNGLAGTGKSTIVKTIAVCLWPPSVRRFSRVGGTFTSYSQRSPLNWHGSTLDFGQSFPLMQSDPGTAYESLYNQMERLIVQPLSETGVLTVIVVDLLDECEDNRSASAILFVLGKLVSKISKVKFFLISRPGPRISEQ
jgi:hypothetical protein